MTDTSAIPWKRLSVEATAIVASILLAFTIDAWWDGVQYRERVLILLTELEPAFAENISQLDQNISVIESHQELLRQFLEADLADMGRIPVDQRFETLHSIWRPATMPNNNTLISERLNTENASFSEFPALQRALMQWRTEVIELEERQERKVANESDALAALGRHNDIGLIWAKIDDGPAPFLSEELLKSVRNDDAVMAIAARKIWLNRVHLRTLQNNRDRSREVLNHIRNVMEQD